MLWDAHMHRYSMHRRRHACTHMQTCQRTHMHRHAYEHTYIHTCMYMYACIHNSVVVWGQLSGLVIGKRVTGVVKLFGWQAFNRMTGP